MNRWLLIPLVLTAALMPLLWKGWFVDEFISHYTATHWLGFSQVIINDAPIYAGLALLLYPSYWPKTPRILSALMRLLAVAVYLIYVIDFLIIAQFNTHLALGDAVKYADYAFKYIQQIYALNLWVWLLIALTGMAALSLFVFSPYTIRHKPHPLSWLVLGAPLMLGFTDNDQYVHAWIYRNVFDYNLTIRSESAPYSPALIARTTLHEQNECQTVTPEPKDIVLLMVESLSAYQSQFFSGIENWTPQLDAIAAQNLAFTQFYANGFITEDGEIALLTGLLPIYPPSSYNDGGGVSFASFYGVEASLPKLLKAQGYRSEFLTSADLEFGNTAAWARSIGFDYVEGHDHPDYAPWPRFHFQAAPDEALYRRALARIEHANGRRLLLFIKTVSTHHPYVNPENQHASEAETFQYADRQLGRFYRQLLDQGFFEHGILLIVGDHHSMTPLKPQEVERFGHYQAAARVPLVVVGATPEPRLEAKPFQQVDVFNTLQGMVAGRQCHGDWRGVLWGEASQPPRFILHRRGDNRDKVSVFSDEQSYLIKLDGDATAVVSPESTEPELRQTLVDQVNALRIRRMTWAMESARVERSQ